MGICGVTPNNKLAFFDYDETLVTHRHSDSFLQADSYFTECLSVLVSAKEEYSNDRALPCMQWFAGKLHGEGYGLYCIADCGSSLKDAIRREKLSAFYPDTTMAYFNVDTAEHKIDLIEAVATAEGCPLKDVLLVDDDMDVIRLARSEGIDARHLSEIVLMYETLDEGGQQSMAMEAEEAVIEEEIREEAETGQGMPDEEDSARLYEECRILAEMNLGKGVV